MSAGVSVFILRGALNGDQIREALLAALPSICRRHRQLAPPIICHVSRDGDVTVVEGKRRSGIKRRCVEQARPRGRCSRAARLRGEPRDDRALEHVPREIATRPVTGARPMTCA
jgi:hypothetical protein